MRDASYVRIVRAVPPMSLKSQLASCRREREANAAPHLIVAVRRSIEALAKTGLVAQAVKAGEIAPRFRLRGRGGLTNLSGLLERGPVVLSFVWGYACPFSALELRALAAVHPEIEHLGATLVALSPQARTRPPSPGSDDEAPFPVLQDSGCEVAARYRIAFTVPQQFRAAYLALGYPYGAPKAMSKAWVLPIPATYVLDSTGLVVLSYLDPDHMTRLEPTDVIIALTHLQCAKHSPSE
jgi:peroxiredoxin